MVPKHADDEKLFGEDPVIASLSLGASRRFILESKLRSNSSKHCFLLQAGDLLVMKGQTQKYWLHSRKNFMWAANKFNFQKCCKFLKLISEDLFWGKGPRNVNIHSRLIIF